MPSLGCSFMGESLVWSMSGPGWWALWTLVDDVGTTAPPACVAAAAGCLTVTVGPPCCPWKRFEARPGWVPAPESQCTLPLLAVADEGAEPDPPPPVPVLPSTVSPLRPPGVLVPVGCRLPTSIAGLPSPPVSLARVVVACSAVFWNDDCSIPSRFKGCCC